MEMKNEEAYYMQSRVRFNALIQSGKENSQEAAELFYYLNKTGFNGLCRFNQSGGFNVPFGRYNSVNYQIDFANLKEIFSDYQFFCGDFMETGAEELGKNAFFFIDSPYHKSFANYSKEGFTWEDHVRLVEWAAKLEGPVLITNKATDEILELLSQNGFQYQKVRKKHTVGASAYSRKAVDEVFAWRNMSIPQHYLDDTNWKQVMRGKRRPNKKAA